MNKILVLSSFPAPYRVDVFRGLAQHFELDVFFATDQDQNRNKDFFYKKDSFQYYIISNTEDNKYFEYCMKKLKSYDMVLAYDWYLKFALKVELLCILHRIPYGINCDGTFILKEKSLKDSLKKQVKRFFIKHAKLCFSSGKSATEYFRYYGAKDEQITEHHFSSLHQEGILSTPIPAGEKVGRRSQLGLSNNRMVLAIGQFIERKGFDVLLEAWKPFDDKYQLVIIGGGEQKDTYQKIIKQSEFHHVTLIEFMTKEKVYQYYLAADLFVLPTREDIWGLVINEAMAMGLPVISTDRCNAALELVNDGSNGYIVPVENTERLINAINTVIQLNELELEDCGKEGINLIKQFTIENIVINHTEQMKRILS